MGAVASPGDVLVAGEESVGRQLRLRNATGEYVSGRLTAFHGDSGMHRFATAATEEWVHLSQRAYRWMSPVSTHARPNPTFRNFPGNHEAIGWKVKVYWNEMGKWYVGRVRAYDQLTGLHKVVFADGDVRWYTIRDEAVVWVEKSTGGKKANGSWMPEGSDSIKSRKAVPPKKLTSSTTTSTSASSFESSMSGGVGTFTPSIARGARGGMTLRPRKNPSLEQLIEKNQNYCIGQTRIGVYWPTDNKYYRGTIKEYNEDGEKYRLLYDDNQEEEIDLEKDAFKWFGPKGITAGYTSLMKEVMLSLGAENVHADPTPTPPDMTPEMLSPLSQPKDIAGRHLWLYWEATGEMYEAEVLAYDTRRKMHYLWFRDGELEWVDLKREQFVWGSERSPKEFPSGLEAGESIPRGKAAVGWRIAVYWRDDVQFYYGRISKYDADTGRHDVDYDDGQMETLSLSTEKIIWKASPSVTAADSSVGSTQQKTQRKASVKRRRLPSPSSEVAKENNAALIESVSAVDSPVDIDSAGLSESVKHLSPDDEDDMEIFPVVTIPSEPLPALQHMRVAKLPLSFGASAFQVKIVARQPDDRMDSVRSIEARTQWIESYQSICSKVGRMPSHLEASSAFSQLPLNKPIMEYPTEAMTGQDTVASRVTHPVLQRQSSRVSRRKKSRPLSKKSSSLGGHSASLESVLASFPSMTQISPKDRQNLPPVISESIKTDVDYSRNLFEAARCGKLPSFLDLPSHDALCCVKDGVESMKQEHDHV